jgi:hypothetical protein
MAKTRRDRVPVERRMLREQVERKYLPPSGDLTIADRRVNALNCIAKVARFEHFFGETTCREMLYDPHIVG